MFLIGECTRDPYVLNNDKIDDPKSSLYVDVIVYPQGYAVNQVQITRSLGKQHYPSYDSSTNSGSLILIEKHDDFTSKMISIMKDPISSLKASLRGEGPNGSKNFRPGEIQHQSTGGAFTYLGNNGDAKLVANSVTEQIHLNPSTNTAIVSGINVQLDNSTSPLGVRVKLDGAGNLILKTVLTDPLTNTETIKSSITLTPFGQISIGTIMGNVDINAATGSININSANDVNITSAKSVNIKGLLVKIGNVTKKLMTAIAKDVFNNHGHEYNAGPTPGAVTSTPTGGIPALINPSLQMTEAVITSKTEAE